VTGILTGNPRDIDQRAWSSFTTTSGLICAYNDRRRLGPILSWASHLPSARWNTAPAPRARLAMPPPPSADGRDSPDCQLDCQSNRLAEGAANLKSGRFRVHNGPGARIAQLVEQLTLIRSPASEIKAGPKGADVHLIFRAVRLTIWSHRPGAPTVPVDSFDVSISLTRLVRQVWRHHARLGLSGGQP
jgi:hypothetical protein